MIVTSQLLYSQCSIADCGVRILQSPIRNERRYPDPNRRGWKTPNERKEVVEKYGPPGLCAYVSPDGIHWTKFRDEPVIMHQWNEVSSTIPDDTSRPRQIYSGRMLTQPNRRHNRRQKARLCVRRHTHACETQPHPRKRLTTA